METIKFVGALLSMFVFFAIPVAVGSYFGTFGPMIAFLTLAGESVIGARIANGSDNMGFGILFIVSMYGAIAMGIVWLVSLSF